MRVFAAIRKNLYLILLFAGIFIIMLMSPLNGDDWYFLNLHTLNPSELWEQVTIQWTTLNGRVLGNISAILFSGLPLIRELTKTVFVFLTIWVMNRLIFTEVNSKICPVWVSACLTTALIYLMPRELFRQTYNWMSGFFNYVPGSLLVFLYFWLIRDFWAGKSLSNRWRTAFLAALLGFCTQLFMENLTIYMVCISIVLTVWYGIQQKKINAIMLCHLLGSIGGAALMFLSPAYRRVSAGEDSYRTMNLTLQGLLEMMEENYINVTWYTFRGYLLILTLLVLLVLILLVRIPIFHSAWMRYLWMGILTAVPVYAWLTRRVFHIVLTDITSLIFWVDASVWIVFWGFMFVVFQRIFSSPARRRFAVVIWLGIPFVSGPLFFVQPIGPRCFYFTYLLLTATILLLLAELLSVISYSEAVRVFLRFVSVFAVLALFVVYFRISSNNFATYQKRVSIVEESVKAGETVIILPKFPQPEFIHETDPQKMSYIYRDYGQITILEK
ncbi:MAG: DUF6056 family protein [Candidatus Merdivicinus sp.]|jgi:hypothetical protein